MLSEEDVDSLGSICMILDDAILGDPRSQTVVTKFAADWRSDGQDILADAVEDLLQNGCAAPGDGTLQILLPDPNSYD
jgi:hypothetical protein